MKERMKYSPHPDNPNHTLMTSEMVVTVRNVPLTTYMESIILNTVSNNAGKGREAMNYVINRFETETKSISDYLDKLKLDVLDMKHLVADNVIKTAQVSIEDLQKRIGDPVKIAAQEVVKTASNHAGNELPVMKKVIAEHHSLLL